MTNTKSTRRALLASVMALLLCVSMLLGTTFAWFTDSVTSGNNVIRSGNLDIELEYWNGTDWADVKDASDILTNQLWEPGATEIAYLRVANAGSLALKYQLGIKILSELEGKNAADEAFKLSDYIKFGVVENVNGQTNPYTADNSGRDAAIAAVTDAKKISAGYSKASVMTPDEELYLALVVYMPESSGNAANHNGIDIPQIDLGISVFATQVEAESDSFGELYDQSEAVLVSTSEELKNAVTTVSDGGTIFLKDGVYDISSQLTIAGKSLSIVGIGENAVIHLTDTRPNNGKIIYVYGNAEGEDITVNVSNVALVTEVPSKADIWIRTDTSTGGKVSGNVTVNLDNVSCATIICDNNYVDGDVINLNITNGEVAKVTLDAAPFNGSNLNTYTNFTYSDSQIDCINIQNAVDDLTHITINGVNPTSTGEQ